MLRRHASTIAMTPARNLVLTGLPRSGTTLCCSLLGSAPDTVALFEPMRVGALPADDPTRAVDMVARFFADSRNSLLERGTGLSQQVGGLVPDNPMTDRRNAAGLRVRDATLGEIRVDKTLSPGFTLVVKHNAAFTALLPALADRFEARAVVRNPLAVLASWNSVDLPVARGRVPAGERLDPALGASLAAEPALHRRQLLILNWFCERFSLTLPEARILRYEEVVASGGVALGAAFGVDVPQATLTARNASRNYDPELCRVLARLLRADRGAWRILYSDADVDRLEAELLAAPG